MTCDTFMALRPKGMCVCILVFSVLISNAININRCNLCKQKLFEGVQ